MQIQSHTTKILIAGISLFFVSFLWGCLQDSCPPPVLFSVKSVKVAPFQRIANSTDGHYIHYTDTLQQLLFEVQPTIEIAARRQPTQGLMSVAYGRCIDGVPLNLAVQGACKIITNRPIYWNGNVIEEGANLLENIELLPFITFPYDFHFEGYGTIEINASGLKFTNHPYTFTFEWSMNDGSVLKDEVTFWVGI